MNATFKKLLGRKTLSRQEVDAALASVQDALVDADVAQVQQPLPLLLDNHTHKPAAI
jgi:signal recognition particle GTPase